MKSFLNKVQKNISIFDVIFKAIVMSERKNLPPESRESILKTAVDLTIKIGVLLLMIFFCFRILLPFVNILLWAMIIAIIFYPVYIRLAGFFRNKNKLAAIILTLFGLAVLLIPSYWLVDSLVDGLKSLAEGFIDGKISIPPPTESVADWPLIGSWLYESWFQASENIGQTLEDYLPQLGSIGEWILGALAGTGLGILQFAVSLIIAGFFLTISEEASYSADKLFTKLVGERGREFAKIAENTIRSVATGVLGVAIFQSLIFGIGLFLADFPLAGVWIILVLVFSIAQLPVIIVTIPMIIYLFAFREPLPAALWSAYLLAASLLDNILKPIIMGRGSSVPMLVIFLGAIGGFIAFGFLGLFLGAIVLSLGFKLYRTWLET